MLEYTRNLLCICDLCKSEQFVQLECRNLRPWVIVAAIAVRHKSVCCWGRTLFWWVQSKHESIRNMGPLKHGQSIKTKHWLIFFISKIRNFAIFSWRLNFLFCPQNRKKTQWFENEKKNVFESDTYDWWMHTQAQKHSFQFWKSIFISECGVAAILNNSVQCLLWIL